MLDVRRLRLLRELHLRGTLAAVAQALAYSPSSVSQQLGLLEREAGVALFEKSGRKLRLTDQARVLVASATRVIDELERAEAEIRESANHVFGSLHIAVFQSAAHALIPGMLTLMTAKFPELRVTLQEREPEQALFDLVTRECDLAIAEQYPGKTRKHHKELDRVEVCNDIIRLAIPDRGPLSRCLSLASSRHAPWVLEPEGTASRSWAMQVCRAAGFEPDVRYQTADLMTHLRLIASGHAVGLIPELLLAGPPNGFRLVDLDVDAKRTVFTSVRRNQGQRPNIVACREALARTAAEVTRKNGSGTAAVKQHLSV